MSTGTIAAETPKAAAGETDDGRQLLRLELSAVFILETGVHAGSVFRDGAPAEARCPARHLCAYSVLPETLPLLLLQGLYGQGFSGDQELHRSRAQGDGDLRGQTVHRRT